MDEALAATPDPHTGLAEAARLNWRADASERSLRRAGFGWTAWTVSVVFVFSAPGIVLLAIEPLTFPAAAICFAHAWAIPWLQARRGARQVVPIGAARSASRSERADPGAEGVALGLLGDLVGHRQHELLAASGMALERGNVGVWLLGEQGAFCLRSRGRRVDCWCVRVAETAELPAGDRVAHLLLALREDELGFAKVANLGFSGATWRVRAQLDERTRVAIDAARKAARRG